MVVMFLKGLHLSRDGEWLTVSIDLNEGLDLQGVDVGTFRLNDSLPAAQADACQDRLRLKFMLNDVRGLFRESMKLTISGSLDDGVRVLGFVTAHGLNPSVATPGAAQCATGR